MIEFNIKQVQYEGLIPLTWEDDHLVLTKGYLRYVGKCDVKQFDSELGLDVEKSFDFQAVVFKASLSGVDMGYSNKKDKYEMTLYYSDTMFTIVFPSKEECSRIFNQIVMWRNEQ